MRYTPPGTVAALVAAYEDDPSRGELTPKEWMERGKKILSEQQNLKLLDEAVRVAYG